jgi:DNA-binding NarL/FixJ family response regulator
LKNQNPTAGVIHFLDVHPEVKFVQELFGYLVHVGIRGGSNHGARRLIRNPKEKALFTIVSAVAQLERDLIRERVSAGIRNAQANGKKMGRPTSAVDRDRIQQLKTEGHSLRQIAARLGVGYGTVRSRLTNQ